MYANVQKCFKLAETDQKHIFAYIFEYIMNKLHTICINKHKFEY